MTSADSGTMNVSYGHYEMTSFESVQVWPSDIISSEVANLYVFVVYVVLCQGLSVLGIGFNAVNILVFSKQGFQDAINISLLGLTLADLSGLVFMLWQCICATPDFANAPLPFDVDSVSYMTAAIPRIAFSKVTSFLTALITFERCLCVAIPLKVKTIMSKGRTKLIVIVIYTVIFLAFSPFYYVHTLKWTFIPLRNSSVLVLAYRPGRNVVEKVNSYIQSVFLTFACIIFVITCTVVLIVKLNNKTKWRDAMMEKSQAKSGSERDKKIIKMVVILSLIFLICAIPESLTFLAMAIEPDLNFGRRFSNTFAVCWATAAFLGTVNSSVNIFVYFTMSSKYRAVLIQTVLAWRQRSFRM